MPQFLDPAWLRSIEPGHFWLLTAAVWTAAVFAFFAGWRLFHRLQTVEDTPKSLVRSAAQGYVELSGLSRLMPGDPIQGPLTRMRCVWWSYSVEEHVGSGKNSRWETISNGKSGELFHIEDSTGRCVIDPEHAIVYPSAKNVWYGSSATPDTGPNMGMGHLGGRYRYIEERIDEDAPLYALGYFHTQGPVSAGDIDEEVRQQLMAWKKDQAWLIQHFDANHDGVVDPQEWEAARAEARRLVLEQERDNLKRPPVDVLSRPPDGREFILSTLPRRKLESRLRLYAAISLLCFLCTGTLGTYLVHVRLSDTATTPLHH